MKKRFIGAGLGMVLVAMLAGYGLAALQRPSNDARAGAATKTATAIAAKHGDPSPQPIFLAEMPKFVAVLQTDGEGDSTYAEIGLTFSSHDPKAVEKFKSVLPIIKAAIVAGVMQQGQELSTGDGAARTKLTDQALVAVNKVLATTDPALGTRAFNEAYLTEFLIQ